MSRRRQQPNPEMRSCTDRKQAPEDAGDRPPVPDIGRRGIPRRTECFSAGSDARRGALPAFSVRSAKSTRGKYSGARKVRYNRIHPISGMAVFRFSRRKRGQTAMGKKSGRRDIRCRTASGAHYAWVITALCMLMMCIAMGLNANTFFLYEPYLMQQFDFTNTQNSLINTARALTVIPGMLSVGFLIRRFGIRRTAAAGIFLQAGTRILFSAAQDFTHCCLASGLAGFSYAWAGAVPVSLLISRWFRDRQGFALGLGMSGSGIASAVFSPLITEFIETRGVKAAFQAEAAFTILAGLAVALFLRDGPEEMGLTPYSAPGTAPDSGEAVKKKQAERPAGRLLTDRKDEALLMLVLMMLAAPGGAGFSHLSVHFSHSGFSSDQIAMLMSILGITLIVGKIVGGAAADHFGGYFSNFLLCGAYLLSMFFCCLAAGGSMRSALLSQVLLGIGLPITNISPPLWVKDLFPSERFDLLVQRCQFFFAVSNFCLQPLAGVIADRTGSYVPAYVIFMGVTVLLLILIQGLYRKAGKA